MLALATTLVMAIIIAALIVLVLALLYDLPHSIG
ncbi:hypothetical protein M233_00730 [Xylella fastidiosa subsp. multiplex Griffin-1]|nr:hypothetical protein M233_00730 [Xylella fastidiosa subsp. multiplex Griffin-1]